MSDDPKNQSDPEEMALYRERSVAYYGALVEAWINTRMERDKQILTLSSLALGGLVAFQATGLSDTWSLGLWFFSSISFIIAIFLALIILSLNARYIQRLAHDHSCTDYEGCLQKLDIALMIVFFAGVLLTFGLALDKSGFEITKKQEVVSNEQ